MMRSKLVRTITEAVVNAGLESNEDFAEEFASDLADILEEEYGLIDEDDEEDEDEE